MNSIFQSSADFFPWQNVDALGFEQPFSPCSLAPNQLPATPEFMNYNLVPDFEECVNDLEVSGPFAPATQAPVPWECMAMPSLPLHNGWPDSTSFTGDSSESFTLTQPRLQPNSSYHANDVKNTMDEDECPPNVCLLQLPVTFNIGGTIFHRSDLLLPIARTNAWGYGNQGAGKEDKQEELLLYLSLEWLSTLDDSDVPQELVPLHAWLRGADNSVLKEVLPDFVEWYERRHSTGAGRGDGCTEDGHHNHAAVTEEDEDGVQMPISPSHAGTPSPHMMQTQNMKRHGEDAAGARGIDLDSVDAHNDSVPCSSSSRKSKKRTLVEKARQLSSSPELCESPSRHASLRRRAQGVGCATPSGAPQLQKREVAASQKRRRVLARSPNEIAYLQWRKKNRSWIGDSEFRRVIQSPNFAREYAVQWRCPECGETFTRDDALARHYWTSEECAESGKITIKVYDNGVPLLNRHGMPLVDHWQHMEGSAPSSAKAGKDCDRLRGL